MLFVFPQFLWLIIIAPAMAWLNWRGGGFRPKASSLLKMLCIVMLVLTLARPMVIWRSSARAHVAVIDVGADLPAIARALDKLDSNTTSVIAFSNGAKLLDDRSELTDPARLARLKHQLDQPVWSDDPSGNGANLAAALQLAGAQIPPDGLGDVQLITRGLSNHGDAEAETYRLAERGIAVLPMVLPIADSNRPAVILRQVELPANASIGQTLVAQVDVESVSSGMATVRLTTERAAPVTMSTQVRPGLNRLSVPFPIHRTGLVVVRGAAWAAGERAPSADGVQAATYVNAAPRLLLVEDAPTPAHVSALRSMLGESADVTVIHPVDLNGMPLADVGAIVLDDLPADRLSSIAQQRLQQAVSDGIGLLITGAARSFGPDGYDDSAMASMLPVRMSQEMQNVDPSTTLVLIIDTSGSMAGEPVDLAKEVSRLAISHLHPHDKVGIVEFYGGRRWAAPLESLGDGSVIHRALERLTAGGGTVLYPAVEEAAFALRNVHTRSKHVFILSDGGVEDAPFAALARQMNDDGINVSTIQCGPGDGTPNNPMPDIARWGGGRFYLVLDQFALPDISFKQPQTSRLSPLVHSPSPVLPGTDALTHDLVSADLGDVDGYVRTQAKPTADVLLKTVTGDPLMVRWRYGSGFVAALPTELGSVMSKKLEDRLAFSTLLTGLVRQIDSGSAASLRIETQLRPAGLEIMARAVHSDPTSDISPLELTLLNQSEETIRHTVTQACSPGHWDVLLPGVTSGSYKISSTLSGSDLKVLAAVAVPMPNAQLRSKPDESLLKALNSFALLAAQRAALLPQSRTVFIDIQCWLAGVSILLFLAHVAVRRWPVQRPPGHEVAT